MAARVNLPPVRRRTEEVMRLRVLTWMFLLAVAGLLLTSCGAGGQEYADQVWNARKALVDGQISYAPLRGMEVGETKFFTAYVGGVERAQSTKDKQQTKHRRVPVNADIGVTLTCSGNVTCQPDGPTRQVVLAGDTREWNWSVRPTGSGKFTLVVTVTAYLADTNTVVEAVHLPPLSMDVPPSLTELLKSVLSVWVIGIVGGLCLVFAALWPVYRDIADRRTTRRRRQEAEQASAAQADHSDESPPAAPPADSDSDAPPKAERSPGS
ncbi:hypothetical protein QQM39_00500 [Streptomyces sp. DT2A-34]|uniref:hypothetical protein n=1 Tax=Streptomyces sp. DT2A-34 TaxID=3051182 RepID=UPI00265C3A25|nr:hypothetical protein [Streptomyces sp. DT2A-34]MDO0909395.1 hypothetical protein [Streptomyces sp. DT2A-34]